MFDRFVVRGQDDAYRLEDLHVDPSLGTIRGPGNSVHLEPRVLALLQALAREPGVLVSRKELLAQLWPGGATYDEALTQCVYQLRHQLAAAGGSEDYRHLIATVSKRGYFLKAETRSISSQLKTIRTLAVLPFLPLLEDNRDPVLELGMADTLITRLGSIRQIVVRPLISVRRYTEMGRDPLKVGQDLAAEAVLDGSIQRVDGMLRVTARLLRVAEGSTVWSGAFDVPIAGIFEIQDDICAKIIAGMAPGLSRGEQASLLKGGTTSAAAYEAYLQARFHLARLTRPDLLASVDHFRRAVELDPQYALAWTGLAQVLFRIPIAGELRPGDFFPAAQNAVQRALAIDDSIAEAHAVSGWISHWYEWNWTKAEELFRHAIEINPTDTECHLGYAHLLADTGRFDLALAEVRKARELSPLYLLAAALEGQILFFAGRNKEALKVLQNARQIDENFWLTRVFLGTVLDQSGRSDEGLAEIRRGRELSSGSSYAVACEVFVLVNQGRSKDANALLDQLLARTLNGYIPPYHVALAHAALGNARESTSWLEQGIAERDPKMALLAWEPRWQRLRHIPAFVQLLSQLNLGMASR